MLVRIEHWFRYFQGVAAFPQMAVFGGTAAELISFINNSGLGVIGTPDECAAQMQLRANVVGPPQSAQ